MVRDFGQALSSYMTGLASMFREDLAGPFCVAMAVRNLRRNPKVGWAFPNIDDIVMPPKMVDRLDDQGLAGRFADALMRGSRYG